MRMQFNKSEYILSVVVSNRLFGGGLLLLLFYIFGLNFNCDLTFCGTSNRDLREQRAGTRNGTAQCTLNTPLS